jgi:NADP-dependent 3-hydroxy acid dehydrogenase YdfG
VSERRERPDDTGDRVAVVTGASSGIGAATVHQLVAADFDVVGGARRLDRLREVTEAVGARAVALDVTDPDSIAEFCAGIDRCDLLVNNAGGALGLASVAQADDAQWQQMYDTNVLGTMRLTRALLPQLLASGDGHIVNVGSIAGLEVYPGGAGYNAAKHALRAVTKVLRLELVGEPVRVTEVDPGMVETEFSLVRFEGDEERAAQVYAGVEALTADDVAECIVWAATRPSHVNIDQLVVKPRDQAAPHLVHRRP